MSSIFSGGVRACVCLHISDNMALVYVELGFSRRDVHIRLSKHSLASEPVFISVFCSSPSLQQLAVPQPLNEAPGGDDVDLVGLVL